MRSKIWLLVIGVCLIFASGAFGYAITFSSSAEFNAAGAAFSNTRISGEGVALKISGGGLWMENGLPVTSNTQDQDQVAMDGDGSGGAYIAWRDKRNNPFGDIYATRVNSSGSIVSGWATSVDTGTPSVVTFEAAQVTKSIKSDGTVDGVIVTYVRKAAPPAYDDIYAEKLSPSANTLWDLGVCKLDATQNQPQIVSDRDGGAVIVWRDYRDGNSAIYAQKINSAGQAVWTSNGVTVCASVDEQIRTTSARDPQVVFYANEGFLIGWIDERAGHKDIYAMLIDMKGGLRDTTHFGQNGIPVSTSPNAKDSFSLHCAFVPPSYYLPFFAWRETGSTNQYVYGQWLTGDGTRHWGNTGVDITSTSGTVHLPKVTGTISGESIFSWFVDYGGVSYESFAQMLNISGEAMWGSGGKSLGIPINYKIASDGSRGAYLSGIGGSTTIYYPCAERIDESGNKVWDENGVQLDPYAANFDNLPLIAFENVGPVYAWADSRNGNKDVFAQKVTDLYYAGGIWTSEQIQNPNPTPIWGPMTWETTGAVTAEVRTASSSSALGSAGWSSISNGGTIPSNGPWIQARMYLSPDSTRTTTAVLNSLSFNYSLDTAYPSVESVTIRGEALSPSTRMWVATTPTIDAVLTDDRRIASADVKIDDASIGYTSLSSTDTRWSIRSQVTSALLAKNYSLEVEVTDDAGNKTTGTYTIAVATKKEVEGSAKVFAEGDKLTINYTLTADTSVAIEIRNLFTGELIRKTVVVSGATGGAAGDNTISIEAGDLGKGVYGYTIYPSGGAPVTGKFAIQ